MSSGGETRLEMCGARSLSVENSSESYSSYRKKFDVFPSLTAILTIYMTLLTTGCEVGRNL